MTSNEEIRDAFVRRQTRLLRTSLGVSKGVIRLLDAAERDLRALIRRRTDVLAGGGVSFGKTTTTRLQKMQEAIRKLQAPVWTDARQLMRNQLLEIGTMELTAASAIITGALPVVVDLTLPNTSLIRTALVSRPFQGKVLGRWMAELEAADRRRMMDAIRIGIIQGESSTQIGRRVFGSSALGFTDGARQVTRRGAQGIAQTAVSHITNAARDELLRANATIVPDKVFSATLDSVTTAICRSLDGQVFKVKDSKAPVLPLHFNERSDYVPAVNGKLIGQRPANRATKKMLDGLRGEERANAVRKLVGQVPASQTYTTFLNNSSVGFQNEALGVGKAKLFRKGKLPLDRFVNSAGREISLRDLRTLSAKDPILKRAFELADLDDVA